MSLSKKIQKLREKPQHIRERILVGSMVVFISIILTIWVITLKSYDFKIHDAGVFFDSSKKYFTSQSQIFDSDAADKMFQKNFAGSSSFATTSTSTIATTSTSEDSTVGMNNATTTNLTTTFSTSTERKQNSF